jgi:hypothetical protein
MGKGRKSPHGRRRCPCHQSHSSSPSRNHRRTCSCNSCAGACSCHHLWSWILPSTRTRRGLRPAVLPAPTGCCCPTSPPCALRQCPGWIRSPPKAPPPLPLIGVIRSQARSITPPTLHQRRGFILHQIPDEASARSIDTLLLASRAGNDDRHPDGVPPVSKQLRIVHKRAGLKQRRNRRSAT